jgi:hypothetical protein
MLSALLLSLSDVTSLPSFVASSALVEEGLLVRLLRLCVAMTFIGHGVAALRLPTAWFGYMATAGFRHRGQAGRLMILIGLLDMALGAALLFVHPLPLVACWCFVWGLSTALIRPLSGEPIEHFIERAGNFLPSLLLLYVQTSEHAPVGVAPSAANFASHFFPHWRFLDYVALSGLTLVLLPVAGFVLRMLGLPPKPREQQKPEARKQ